MGVISENQQSIREINLLYLTLAQRILREDKTLGMCSLGVSQTVADLLTKLTPERLLTIASADQLVCFFRFDDRAILAALGQKGKSVVVAEIGAVATVAQALMAGDMVS